MSPTTKIRCSSTDRALACASSMATSAVPYNPNSDEAREGHAGHEALSYIPRGEAPPIDDIAARYGVDRDTLAMLVARGSQAWRELDIGRADTEVEMSAPLNPEVTLRGTTDVLRVASRFVAGDDAITVLDWKLGWAPSEHPAQLKSYAYLARATNGMPESGCITGIEVWARLGEIRTHRFDAATLDDHARALLEQVKQIGKQYGPGADSCRYCPHQQHCAARDEWLRGAISALAPVASGLPVTRETIGALYEQSRQLGAVLRQYDQAVDLLLVDGPIPLGDGRQLTLEIGEQDKITPSVAIGYLRDEMRLTPEEADEAITVTKGGLDRVIKARAPRGKAAAMMRATMGRLRDLGAIETVAKPKKVVKK